MDAKSIIQAPSLNLRWRLYKTARRGRRFICSKLYQDKNRDPGHSIIVAGAARSGTTWLGDLIASQISSRIMFEPFHSELVEGFAQFNYFQYMRPDQKDVALYNYVRRILTGQIRDHWIDRQVETIWPKWRVIKDVRACLFLRWIHNRFPEVPIVLIIRHPCAVVASRIKLGWAPDHDLDPLLEQEHLIEDFLGGKLTTIKNARTDEEKHAIAWCVSNLVPLRQFRGAPLHVVYYENLYLHPEEVIPEIFSAIGQPCTESVFRYARRPSTTTRMQSAVLSGEDIISSWRHELSANAIARVLGIVDDLGLGHLYGDSYLPLQKTQDTS